MRQTIHPLKNMGGKLWQLFIFLDLDTFPHYFVFTEKLNITNMKWKLSQLDKYLPRKTKVSMGQLFPSHTIWEKNCGNF